MDDRDEVGAADAYCYEYPRPAMTADVVCLNRGRVLLVQRKYDPFAGCWALPGGFVEPNETAAQGGVRELDEECGVRIAVDRLIELGAFTEPGRDPRGWVVSVAFAVELSDEEATSVAPGSDARFLEWRQPDAVPALAFDHAAILARAPGTARV